jgi:phosphoglycerate dehydrogenase-like enzyme
MPEPIEVLMTVPMPDELVAQINEISNRLKVTVLRARRAEEVPADVWARTEILYTDRVLPSPEQAPKLRWIQLHYAGMDHVAAAPILQKPDVVVTTLSGVAASQIAEYALMMLLALGHHLPDLINNQRKAEWPEDRWERFSPVELRGSTVGIVGYGSIGRQIARLLQDFGATVLATKRNAMHPEDNGFTLEGQGDPGGDLVNRLYPSQALRSMLKECDFVVVTLPLTGETLHIIGAGELESLKSSAYLVNISRGGVIDQNALISALKEHQFAGAALDVFTEEPLPPDNPLWKMPNVIITPHISGNTRFYDERAVLLFTENLHRYLAGLPLYNRFDPQKGY